MGTGYGAAPRQRSPLAWLGPAGRPALTLTAAAAVTGRLTIGFAAEYQAAGFCRADRARRTGRQLKSRPGGSNRCPGSCYPTPRPDENVCDIAYPLG
jgi:hypothetical protein